MSDTTRTPRQELAYAIATLPSTNRRVPLAVGPCLVYAEPIGYTITDPHGVRYPACSLRSALETLRSLGACSPDGGFPAEATPTPTYREQLRAQLHTGCPDRCAACDLDRDDSSTPTPQTFAEASAPLRSIQAVGVLASAGYSAEEIAARLPGPVVERAPFGATGAHGRVSSPAMSDRY